MNTDHDQLTVSQAAKISGLSTSTLKRRITTKQLPAKFSESGSWVVQRGDLMSFLAVQGQTMSSSNFLNGTRNSVHEPAMNNHDQTIVEHLVRSLDRERALNEEFQRLNSELRMQNKELQGEILKLNAELLALLKGEGKGMLSRWIKKA